MTLIVGLGNPGKKFQNTWHNLGFRVIDELADRNNFPSFKLSKKFKAEINEGEINGKKIVLAKPQTFMNNSGKSVKLLTKFYRKDLDNLLVIHDDIDLPLGKTRIIKNRGAAGHKGVQSIINELGNKNFIRFRVGILSKIGKQKKLEDFVLQKFNKGEEKILKEVIEKAVRTIEFLLKEGLEKTMNEFNK